jgi:hypothetical protein
MRRFLWLAAAALLSTSAAAQSTWQEYTYPDQQFAVSFPAQPIVETKPFKAADGTTVTETVYSVRNEAAKFELTVVDFSGQTIDGASAIDQAVNALRDRGDVKLDIAARVQRNVGRYLNVAARDGSHTIAAVFFGGNRLYEIEGTVPASNPDGLSGEMIRFQQSLRFTGDAAGARGRGFARGQGNGQFQGPGQFPGRGQFRGRRQWQDQPPADAPPSTPG